MNEILELWQIQNLNAVMGKNVNSLLVIYAVLCIVIKRPVFLLAFLLPEIIHLTEFFNFISITGKYCIEILIYTYVFEICKKTKSKIACVIICFITIMFMIDNILYGVGGTYGEVETLVYNNISSTNTCAHILLIVTLIPYRRIRDSLRDFIDGFVRYAHDSYFMQALVYNLKKENAKRR